MNSSLGSALDCGEPFWQLMKLFRTPNASKQREISDDQLNPKVVVEL